MLSAQSGSATSDVTGSPYGAITTEHGEYKPTLVDANGDIVQQGFTDYDYDGNDPSETIATGDNLSAAWNEIIQAMDAIEAEGHLYRPLTQNSNTAVDEALIRAGLGEPQRDDFGENLSPGSGGLTGLIGKIKTAVSANFIGAENFIRRRDPLTLDLDGDGIETTGIDPLNPILFDHDGDGLKTATGWVGVDDAFLVLDRNGNGAIDSGRELFGDSTPLTTGANAADGFAALAEQDSNSDGVVNSADASFASLRLWQDLNQNGLSEAGELFTLNQKGIAAIHVAKTENSILLPNGNVIADVGSYTRTDGSAGELGTTGDLGDVDLREDTFHAEFTDAVPLTPETESLPDMHGSGQVRDLRRLHRILHQIRLAA